METTDPQNVDWLAEYDNLMEITWKYFWHHRDEFKNLPDDIQCILSAHIVTFNRFVVKDDNEILDSWGNHYCRIVLDHIAVSYNNDATSKQTPIFDALCAIIKIASYNAGRTNNTLWCSTINSVSNSSYSYFKSHLDTLMSKIPPDFDDDDNVKQRLRQVFAK